MRTQYLTHDILIVKLSLNFVFMLDTVTCRQYSNRDFDLC